MRMLYRPLVWAAFGLIGAAQAAQAGDTGYFFVDGNVGQSAKRVPSGGQTYDPTFDSTTRISMDRKDLAGALRFGYRWRSVVDYGLEAGYVDLGSSRERFSYTSPWYSFNSRWDQEVRGWLLGGTLSYTFAEKWSVNGRAGWFRSRVNWSGENIVFLSGGPDSESQNSYNSTRTGEYAGVGISYAVTPSMSFGLSYDNYHARFAYAGGNLTNTIAMYSASAEYRF